MTREGEREDGIEGAHGLFGVVQSLGSGAAGGEDISRRTLQGIEETR